MGGKGQRRREKNYRAAHGGDNRLPPPPKLKELEALPSKLRKIMEFKNPSSTTPGSLRSSVDSRNERRKAGAAGEKAKKTNPKDVHSSAGVNLRRGENLEKTASDEHKNDKDATTNSSINSDSKRKRKWKAVNDFRFQESDQAASHLRKKKRKEYLEAKKKKHKKAKTDDVRDFPGREDIKFGEIVEAPPRLSLPKALKKPLDASHERMRLQAIEAYRNRRGWTSRPGIQLPTLPEAPS
ncbi:coiled-coil domain-containing protein [Cocos nucifera]|uniref:Coiled-coil domain-containing protein n=1 Tax=Cocos nucifera TaxID=13894 RepID=A0A8K0IJ31_COCNU|nr:coiled-coil domain-containing protein [Cocos nucifera]